MSKITNDNINIITRKFQNYKIIPLYIQNFEKYTSTSTNYNSSPYVFIF